MINLLNPPINKFTHIIQIADIHVRLNQRGDEYREVFNRLYDAIRLSPESTLVVCAGDVVHNKVDLSPECVQMVSDFFTSIANLRPLILIPGNHDCLIVNKNRLDSLTPIVDALNHSNLYYLKKSGLYGFGNILFNNMCVFDPVEKYILGKDIPAIYRNQYEHIIALFHGAIDGSVTDNGYRMDNPSIMTPLFDDHDIALCGDIHLMQDIQEYNPDENKPCVRYCGSLCQQNHGEYLYGHGYSLWDLKTKSYTHHEIPNDFGYFTIEVNKGQLVTDLKDIPKKVRLRVKCYESIASEIKAVIAKIKGITQVIETAYVRMDQERDKKDIIPLCKDIVLKDLTIIDYQEKLITEFLQKKLGIIDSLKIQDILKINKDTNSLIKKDEFARNLKWKPIRFEWDNMFTYGEGNVIDFTHMNGTYGIFGPNKSGKSSILSAIIFCLFDKFDRGFKGRDVLNVQKTSFKCKLEFEISGVRYFIERKGITTRSGNVKVDVRFWKVVGGVEEDLHGTARRDTNDIIRDYIGTYEDFVLTAASFQNAKNNSSFIDMGHSERKDLLVQFTGLNVFDRLHEAAGERSKELNTILKLHKDKNYSDDIRQDQDALENAVSLFQESNKILENLKKQIAEVNEQIVAETSNLIKLDNDVPTNLSVLESKKTSIESSIKDRQQALERLKVILAEKEAIVVSINEQIKKIEESNLVGSHKTYRELSDKIGEVKQQIELKKVEVKGKLEKVARLDKHQYDPKCKFCTNNAFVKDATKAKNELVDDKKESDKMLVLWESLKVEFSKFQWVEKAYETYTKLLTDKSKVENEYKVLSRNIISTIDELGKLNTSDATITHQIEIYHKNAIAVETNEKIQSKISSYRTANGRLDIEFRRQNQILMDISGKMEIYKAQIATLTKTLNEVSSLEYESDSYQKYLEATGRDGVSFQVICNLIPELEREVNSILSQIVDYTIQFDTDGKNIIPYVVYTEMGKYPIELSSGAERFISSIAIRVALTNVSNLPKISALFLDEGMGTLDPNNMMSMSTLFSMLKNYYDFIVVISHIDSVKDFVDKVIEISHDNGLAKVVFE